MWAARSTNANGKKHPHQYRLQNQTLQQFGEILIRQMRSISAATTFEELISAVRNARIYGIGELAIYDVAVRIGAFKNIWPEKIYLHAGARVGASALIDNLTSDVIEKNQLPSDFRNSDLSCYELEDILCIYKHFFQHARNIGKVN